MSNNLKRARVLHTPAAHERLEKSLDRLQDENFVPDWLVEFIHTLACKLVERDYRLAFESMKPCALYAIGVLISEWIFHITGTAVDSIDKVINIWSAVSAHYNKLQLKKNNILSLQVDHMVSTLPSTENISETQKKEIDQILAEISQLRDDQRISRIEKEYAEPQVILKETPQTILTQASYNKFTQKVNESLFFEPPPDRTDDFHAWLEWSKNRWNYKRQLNKLKQVDDKNVTKFKQILKQKETKKKMIEEKKKRLSQKKMEERQGILAHREQKKKKENIERYKARVLQRQKIVSQNLIKEREFLAKRAAGKLNESFVLPTIKK